MIESRAERAALSRAPTQTLRYSSLPGVSSLSGVSLTHETARRSSEA
jgi:hypothetical protein